MKRAFARLRQGLRLAFGQGGGRAAVLLSFVVNAMAITSGLGPDTDNLPCDNDTPGTAGAAGGMRSAFFALLRRDLRLAFRQGGDGAAAILFFVLTAILFAFGIGPDEMLLARIAAGIVWVIALLASLLALERLFQADWEDGTLDLIALSPLGLELAVLAKALAHWLTAGLPLLAAIPIVALLLHLDPHLLPSLEIAMALATPSLSLVGSMGAALVLGARRGGVLIALIILPLEIPILIFGATAAEAALAGEPAAAQLKLLGAILAFALPLCPFAAGAALRQAIE